MEHRPPVLLITRNRQERAALVSRVETIGYEVLGVQCADTALELLRARSVGHPKPQFCLVIAERDAIDMPAISLVDEMRSERGLKSVPVLVVARALHDSDQVAAHRLGHCRVIKHHANDSVLAAGIKHLLTAR